MRFFRKRLIRWCLRGNKGAITALFVRICACFRHFSSTFSSGTELVGPVLELHSSILPEWSIILRNSRLGWIWRGGYWTADVICRILRIDWQIVYSGRRIR